MLLTNFRQQQLQHHSTGTVPFHRPLSLLLSFSGCLWLASSPAVAQPFRSQEISATPASGKTVSGGTAPASLGLNGSSTPESADFPFTPVQLREQNGNVSEPARAKTSLDSPPSPEIAATLCGGTAETLPSQTIITSETVCQSGLTPPSLWWTKEQVAQELRTSGKLVSDWSTQLKTADAPGQVRLVVNPQMWSLMDYFERYDFVSNFGLAARDFGYQTEIYNTKGTRLASYVCQLQNPSQSLGSSCKMTLGSSLNFGSRTSRKSFL